MGSSIGQVEVRRSRKRRRTVSAYRDGGVTIVSIPAAFTAAEERQWVARMVARLDRRERRSRPSDEELLRRAGQLSSQYMSGVPQPSSITWVDNQQHRWGSCTPADGSIRLSSRMHGFPTWVVDYVIVHELAHLVFPGHSKEFWALVGQYPDADRARGFLHGYDVGRGQSGEPEPVSDSPDAVPGLDDDVIDRPASNGGHSGRPSHAEPLGTEEPAGAAGL